MGTEKDKSSRGLEYKMGNEDESGSYGNSRSDGDSLDQGGFFEEDKKIIYLSDRRKEYANLETYILERKVAEYSTLTNRLKRYANKLVLESFRIASEEGLDVYITTPRKSSFRIKIIKNGDSTDFSELIKLAKTKYPSLYRRYTEAEEKHSILKKELKRIYGGIKGQQHNHRTS